MATEIRRPKVEIPKSLIERFNRGFLLSVEKLKEINAWVRAHEQYILEGGPEQSGAYLQLGISREDFYSVVSIVGTFVFSAGIDAPADLNAFIEELKNKGMEENAGKARALLEGISIDYGVVEYERQKSLVLQSVVPTLEDIDCTCDLRAIFRRLPSPSQSAEHLTGVKVLLGFEPVVQVSFNTNDASDNDHSWVFQVTEQGLKRTIKVLAEAATQLEIIKEAKVPCGRLQ